MDAGLVADQVAEQDLDQRAGLIADDKPLQQRVDIDAGAHVARELDLGPSLLGRNIMLQKGRLRWKRQH